MTIIFRGFTSSTMHWTCYLLEIIRDIHARKYKEILNCDQDQVIDLDLATKHLLFGQVLIDITREISYDILTAVLYCWDPEPPITYIKSAASTAPYIRVNSW